MIQRGFTESQIRRYVVRCWLLSNVSRQEELIFFRDRRAYHRAAGENKEREQFWRGLLTFSNGYPSDGTLRANDLFDALGAKGEENRGNMYVTYCSWLCMRGSRWCAKIGQIDRAFVFVHHARLRPPIIKFYFLAKITPRDVEHHQGTRNAPLSPMKRFPQNFSLEITLSWY